MLEEKLREIFLRNDISFVEIYPGASSLEYHDCTVVRSRDQQTQSETQFLVGITRHTCTVQQIYVNSVMLTISGRREFQQALRKAAAEAWNEIYP